MIENNQISYLILYEILTDEADSKGFLRCSNIQEVFETITRLAIQICEQSHPNEKAFNFKSILNALETIPYLKVYQSINSGELKETVNFYKQYRNHYKRMCGQAQNYYSIVSSIFKSEEKKKAFFQKMKKTEQTDAQK